MKQWTHHAEERLSEYLHERSAREGLDGGDAAELKEDLRSHIHEEAERSPAGTIGLMELETIIGRLDAGYRPTSHPLPSLTTPAKARKKGRFGRFCMWTFGVLVPTAVIGFEMVSSFCGGVFFNPVPTWFHAVLLLMVPAINAWLLRGKPRGNCQWRGAASGFVCLTSCFYAALFVPLVPLSIIALLAIGLGFLSLSPIFAAVATCFVARAEKSGSGDLAKFRSAWWKGLGASLFVMFLLEGPALWTRINLDLAASDGAGAPAALARLRTYHSERTLLTACYEGNRGTQMATDISGWILRSWRIPAAMLGGGSIEQVDSEKTRDLFFRVTGSSFNSFKPPAQHRGGRLVGRGDPMADMEFDDHLGGDEVAVRLKHLDLAESRWDGHVDTVSRLGYGEWTMVFKNTSEQPKEARCQVRLPQDGRVSRLTLWVNGEPREAAFSTVSKVKAAYKAVAVVQRRDPVLVNVVGPDTVMVQCFPVPARGEMKIRLGVTAPLHNGRWELPYIIERNFGTLSALAHAVWLQGNEKFDLTNNGQVQPSHVEGDGFSLPVTLEGAAAMAGGLAVVAVPNDNASPLVYCEDRFASPEERFLMRDPITWTRPGAEKLIVVIDGSVSLKDHKEALIRALDALGAENLHLLLANDRAEAINMKQLASYQFSGGRDNEPALREGIRMAKEHQWPVVWVHGPQAVGLTQTEALIQMLERGTVKPVIHQVESGTGPNRLAEAIYRSGCLKRGPALKDSAEDVSTFLQELRMTREEAGWNWKRSAAAPVGAVRVWDQLARYWAGSAVEDSRVVMTDPERAELAARYQLVTPFSGAVVLETEQQYADHGLSPADGDATPRIPNVPEPSSFLLFLISAAAALMRRTRPAAADGHR